MMLTQLKKGPLAAIRFLYLWTRESVPSLIKGCFAIQNGLILTVETEIKPVLFLVNSN